MNNIKKTVAEGLLKIGAVFLRPEQPFTWASGIKSPIYCDNRLTLTAPEVRTKVEEGLVKLVREHFPECEVLMGTATAGIAHAAIIAHIMGLPMGLEKGQKVVVVEDLISTAKSSLEVVDALREEGADVIGMVSIFTYGMQKARERLAEAEVKAVSLCDLDELLDVAVEEGYIPAAAKTGIFAFRDDPSDESWINK